MTSKKTKTVKAWCLVVEIKSGLYLDLPEIFYLKKGAEYQAKHWGFGHKVVPCTITYSLPTKQK